ncbi:hypothetical protein ACLMJK_003771 [Lecanora helva]
MSPAAPRVTIARPARSSGVLSIPASATQQKPKPQQEAHTTRASSARLKIIIRRLPPGLTQIEFEDALGIDWKFGQDKVDWGVYKAGKISKDPAKASRPSRAYFHVRKQEFISLLSDKIRNTTFTDAKGTSKDSTLLGTPSVEFAPYGRVPNGRPRKDARQGTIDQDPEFIDFLESLTNPITKTTNVDQENEVAGKSKEKVTTTPLVQFLKDKKANKGKENAVSQKGAKHARQDPKDVKSPNPTDNKSATGTSVISSPKKRSAQAVKVEQAARDAVKVLNKQAANMNKGPAAPTASPGGNGVKSPNVTPNNTANSVLADKKRERGSASAAAKILQRDLGLGNAGGRGGRRGTPPNVVRAAATSPATANKQENTSPQGARLSVTASTPSPTVLGADTTAKAPSGPAASPATKTSGPAPNSPSTPNPSLAKPASTATQAFLKHANPSQGITELLLEEAFTDFGKINKVEIDKKKGFAYVDFTEPESLQKAIKASPIKVAQGQVVVLERKTGANLQARNVRGGSPMMGHGGGGMPVGGRGGTIRGRGGFGRGGMNMPKPRSPAAAAPVATKPAFAATKVPAAAPSTSEASPAATGVDPPAPAG